MSDNNTFESKKNASADETIKTLPSSQDLDPSLRTLPGTQLSYQAVANPAFPGSYNLPVGQPVMGQPVLGQPFMGAPGFAPYPVMDQRVYEYQMAQLKYKNDTNCFTIVLGIWMVLLILGLLGILGTLILWHEVTRGCDAYAIVIVMGAINNGLHLFSSFLIYTAVKTYNQNRLLKGKKLYIASFCWGLVTQCVDSFMNEYCVGMDAVVTSIISVLLAIIIFIYITRSIERCDNLIKGKRTFSDSS
jgi:hypothetical protein